MVILHRFSLFKWLTQFYSAKIDGYSMELVYYFSIWIFIWWVLYKANVLPYSPLFALLVAISVNMAIVLGMILQGLDTGFIMYYILISITFMKLFPLSTLQEPVTRQSIHAFLALFSVYLIFSYATGKTIPLLIKGYTDIIYYPETTHLGYQYAYLKI